LLFATDKINLTQRRKDRRENLFVLFVKQSYSLCVLCILSEQSERALWVGTGGWTRKEDKTWDMKRGSNDFGPLVVFKF